MKALWSLFLAIALIAGVSMFALGDDDDRRRGAGPRGYDGSMGPGMMGWEGGMMGGGMMGRGMMSWGWDNGLSKEQLDKLDQLHTESSRAMREAMFANRDRMTAIHEAMSKFPLDEKAALEQWKAMDAAREATFKQHVSTMAKAQQIVGKEKWEQMMDDMGDPGRGRGMMRNR